MLAVLQRVTDEQKSHVLLLEVGLPGRSGLEIIADVYKQAPQCGIVILTVFDDEDKISRAAAVASALTHRLV